MNVYVLREPTEGPMVTDFLPVEGSPTGEAIRCPVCGRNVASLPLLPPIRVELEVLGDGFGDIAFGVANLLVSDRFYHLFETHGLTGLSDIHPVEIVEIDSRRNIRYSPPKYYLCRIQRSRAAINRERSGFQTDRPVQCEECRSSGIIKRALRIELEENTWSGEDIFTARGLPGTILTSERFKRFCDGNKFSNCELVPAEDYSFDHYYWESRKN
jgi:DNA-directed RNA polymerase subunit RPC12/RpoP